MLIRIQRGSAVPISRQISEQIRAQCTTGTLRPGTALPSVRQLAAQLAVNVNTVFRVYERLSGDGVLEMRQGEGTFVAPPKASSQSDRQRDAEREQFATEFVSLAQRGLMWGFSAQELKQLVAAAARDARKPLTAETTE
ncbi:MAG: GntR family transcriptional regulator [Planctomycetaceae bacterium]|nr:GntR family transcriptional regulator [Planctomycetaceae bacterium]